MDRTTTTRLPERLLIVDDDQELCELVTEYLQSEGFVVDAVRNGEEAFRRIAAAPYSVVILDVMLPEMNGFDILRRLRSQSDIPVIMLTARGEDVDRIVGLEIGADDYLPKPFNPRELVARIRAVLRRTLAGSGPSWGRTVPSQLEVGDVTLDPGTRTVKRAGTNVELTGVEFALLEILLRAAGQAVSREELSKRVLDRELTPYDRSIDMHISNIRKKLGHRIGSVERIKTIRNGGYLYTVQ
jgi:DNA-binding response OmpR family regulator